MSYAPSSALVTDPPEVPPAPSADKGRRESPDAVLGKNLAVARTLTGLTQHELAARAGISRATVAQLETGYSDPRLSTIVDLATALGISPIVLLLGTTEVRALRALPSTSQAGSEVTDADVTRMLDYLQGDSLKDRVRAARIGASMARRHNPAAPSGAAVTAGVLSAILPGPGTMIGAALGELLAPISR